MVKEIELINKDTNDSIIISDSEGVYVLYKIDWGMPAVSFNNYRIPFQIGETLESVVIGTREISIIGYVISGKIDILKDLTIKEYYAIKEKDIEENKLVLDKLINVNQDLLIMANGYQITGRPKQPVKYSSNYSENNEVLCMFNLDIVCVNPMFTKGEKTFTMIGVEKRFHFPLTIPKNKGVIFGVKTKNQALIILNSGDSEVGMEIIIEAKTGQVENPKIYNVQTGEFISFVGLILEKGDRLIINTSIGEESAVWHKSAERTERSVTGKIMPGSTLMRLRQGSTILMYDLNNPTLVNSNILVSFYEQYVNIRGM